MKTLVWGDIHNRIEVLKSFLGKYGDRFGKRIFLGDWFDQFGDNPDQAKATAVYLVELMSDPRNVFILGNHDQCYMFHNTQNFCSGFTWDKLRFISTVLDGRHWSRFKCFEYEQGWLCSHAGAHPAVFEHPVHGINVEQMEIDCEKAIECARANFAHPALKAGISSGGNAPYGGITWLRWWELQPIKGVNQIVGHTILREPEIIYGIEPAVGAPLRNVRVTATQFNRMPPKKDKLCSINWNIDTNNSHFAIIENGEVTIEETEDYL